MPEMLPPDWTHEETSLASLRWYTGIPIEGEGWYISEPDQHGFRDHVLVTKRKNRYKHQTNRFWWCVAVWSIDPRPEMQRVLKLKTYKRHSRRKRRA